MPASRALVFALILLSAGRVMADGTRLVVVLEREGPSGANAQALAELRNALDDAGVFAPSSDEIARLRDTLVDPALLPTAVELRERAATHFAVLESTTAARTLEEASVIHLHRFADVLGDPEAGRAALLAAAVFRAQGLSSRAREEIRRAIVYDPDTPPDPAEHPPEIVEAYQAEREYLFASGLPLPPAVRLCEAARLLRADVLVVPVREAAPTQSSLGLDVYDPGPCSRHVVTVADGDMHRAANEILVPTAAMAAATALGPPPTRPAAPVQPPPTTPWYTRWYTLASAGALLVGSVVIAAVLLSTGDPEFHLREDAEFATNR